MISQLGQGLVLFALLACALGAPIGFFSGASRSERGLRWTRALSLAFAGAMVLATVLMEFALLRHDFSVSYVAQVGSLATPWHITFVSLWSSLEGSILFWGWIVAFYMAAVAYVYRDRYKELMPGVNATVPARRRTLANNSRADTFKSPQQQTTHFLPSKAWDSTYSSTSSWSR